jgi:hypothetical protein
MTSQVQFLYSILEDAKKVVREVNGLARDDNSTSIATPLALLMAHAAVVSDWGKKAMSYSEMFDTSTTSNNKFYMMAVEQVRKSRWMESVMGAIRCTQDGK